MSTANDLDKLLQCTPQPAFLVREGTICRVNHAAAGFLIPEGAPVDPLISTGKEDYAAFTDGCLYLSLSLHGQIRNATVQSLSDGHLFLLDDDDQPAELRALALAARELRTPLSELMLAADLLLPRAVREDDSSTYPAALLSRSLYKFHRLISNMSDASRYYGESNEPQETLELSALVREIVEKVDAGVSEKGIRVIFRDNSTKIYSLGNRQLLERAVYNLLSNAIAHMPDGGEIQVQLHREGARAYLRVDDCGNGHPDGSMFTRYRRAPSLENEGIGLGMVLVQAAARCHGGTVLVQERPGGGLRVTLSMVLRQRSDTQVRSPGLTVDYAGERDHMLLELSGVLDVEAYTP